jgi:shikimate dehydrogenase
MSDTQQIFDWREAPAGDFAVIGDPIEHTLSPRMHEAAFAALGESYTYRAIRVQKGDVADALLGLRDKGYKGINVTVPHKFEANEALTSASPLADRCRVINTVRLEDLYGINTDGPGFMETIEGRVPQGSDVLLLGAGGSARAIALALAEAGYNIRVFNRTPERAVLLVRELDIQASVVDNPDPTDVQLIVNATSLSLQNETLAVPFERAAPGALAYDLVYGATRFLAEAASAGLATIDGKALLVAQGALSQEFWLERPAPRKAMMEAVQ